MAELRKAFLSTSLAAVLIISIGSMTYEFGLALEEANAQTSLLLSGRVTNSSGSGIPNAKVYIDGYKTSGLLTSQWYTVIADTNGYWSKSVLPGYTYTVDASKFLYSRDRWPNQITTSTPNINLTINLQATKGLDLYIVADEEFRAQYGVSWQTAAWSKLASKQSFFNDNFNIIVYQEYIYTTWNSPNTLTSFEAMMNNAATTTGWSSGQYQGADVMAILTRDTPLTCNGGSAKGCADVPSGSGQHPRAMIDDAKSGAPTPDVSNHELVHNYGFNHIASSYATIMQQGGTGAIDYNTMSPPEDTTMAMNGSNSKRLWY